MKLVASVATLITNSACDPIDNSGLLQGQGGQADGMGGQGGAASSSSSSSSGQAGAGGQGGAASSSSSSSGQAGAGGQGGAASSSTSSSSGQAGAGGQGGGASSSSSSGQAGAGGQGGAASSSSSSSSGQAGAGGEGGGASSSSSSSSGQAGAGGQGGAASSSSSSSSGQAGAGGQGGAASSSSSSSSGQAGAGGGGICLDGQTQSCYGGPNGTENIGACKAGTQTCVGGMWSTCSGDIVPVAEACDNLDNDCNGQADEGNPGGGFSCPTGQLGACAAGMTACAGGTVVCNAINQPKAEACDGLDNDCDGQVDEGNPGGGLACNTGQLGICVIGTTACTGGSVVCNATTQPVPEACDALDNDCNGQVDEGNPGGGLACNTGKSGVCGPGTTSCSGGAIKCNAITPPTFEICDTLDNDCDGMVDEGNPGGGASCSTGQPGVCAAGFEKCMGGAIACNPVNQPQPELCDNLDNDCNGQVDDGNPGLGMPCNTGQVGACGVGSAQCVNGTTICNVVNQPSPEICDNIDNDCDGQVDEGNPGGGMACGPSIGGCQQKMVCINGAVVCGGTFVGPAGVGAAGNPGTPAQPLSTIAAAQAKAQLFGGADICLCGGTYKERVTMIEGISVYGGYDCANWSRNISANTTTIEDPIQFPNGPAITFPPGITAATALDGVTVQDLGYWGSGGPWAPSIAISIEDSSPILVDVFAHGDNVWDSRGMVVSGTTSAPTVLRGGYYSHGVYDTFSSQSAVILSGASGTFTDVTIQALGYAAYSTGLSCGNCGATIVGGNIYGGGSQTGSTGLMVSGNVGAFSITGTSIAAGAGGFGISYGARFYNCTGSPSLSNVNIAGSGNGDGYGVHSTGSQCAPAITGSTVDEQGGTNGIVCTDNSPCSITNSTITANGSSSQLAGMYCEAGGCSILAGNTISIGGNGGAGLHVKNSNPSINGNRIASPSCSNPMGSTIRAAAYFENSSSTITNNVFYDKPCAAPVDVLILDNSLGASPMFYNNTVLFTTCAGCPTKRGLLVKGSSGTGIVRNNIFANAGIGGFANGYAVYEEVPASFLFLANNLLWAPNGGTLYLNEGSSALLLPAINALSGSTGNISADPMLDATFHLLPNSPCRNAGTANGAPALDFDGNSRPQEMVHDIGADEYVP